MFQTIRIYEKNPITHFQTQVVDVSFQTIKLSGGEPTEIDAIGLILAETIFHPQGGGQPSDRGTINGEAVLMVHQDKSQDPSQKSIYHFVESNEYNKKHFLISQNVTLEIDSAYRFQCARSHSVGHLIADILEFEQHFASYSAKVTRGHHFPGGEYIKVLVNNVPDDTQSFIEHINQYLKKYISRDLTSLIQYNEKGIRHIKFGDSERMCGGTHVKSTLEIKNCGVTKIKQGKDPNGSLELTVFYHCL